MKNLIVGFQKFEKMCVEESGGSVSDPIRIGMFSACAGVRQIVTGKRQINGDDDNLQK